MKVIACAGDKLSSGGTGGLEHRGGDCRPLLTARLRARRL
jgi:hypothetical protein